MAKLYAKSGYETFVGDGDIYCLFYERGIQILKDHGVLCYITSNKWLRSDYGLYMRNFFVEKTNPIFLIDFGETHVFESATVMTNIIICTKDNNNHELVATQIRDDFKEPSALKDYFDGNSIICDFEINETWIIADDSVRKLRKKISSEGKQLINWNIDIYRGILTGCDKAFFVSTDTRNAIISSCESNEEKQRTEAIIRPMLQGKNIRKFGIEWAKKWMINTHNGVKGVMDRIDVDEFPAIKKHLNNYYAQLIKRSDKGDTPYNLRNCAYILEFDKPKIIYPETTKFMPFYLDEKGFLTTKTCFIMVGEHISYLTAFFNSSLFKYCFRDNFVALFGNARSLGKTYFEKIPVLEVNDKTDNEFRELVLDIQQDYSDEKAKAIDQRIFDLYGLTQEERDIIGYIDYHGIEEDNNEG